MIYIISYHGEPSTCNVIAWLKYSGAKFRRINFSDFINEKIPVSIGINSGKQYVAIDHDVLEDDFAENNVVWLRKLDVYANESINNKLGNIHKWIKDEYSVFTKSLMLSLKKAKWLCNSDAQYLNKIDVLNQARQCGLNIPETIVTNNKIALENHLEKFPKSITKCISDGMSIKLKDKSYLLSTTLICKGKTLDIPDFFVPSIVQEYIEKEVELRIFYLDGAFFTAAIFSQKQAHTTVDFRINLIDKKDSRIVPFELPENIKLSLTDLMQKINLNTGSIDMIYSKDKRYYFLEINPAGQYDWVDYLCNHNIDRHIANYLIKQAT
jgi:ATP-GRASP peptide maturase of grasp-with-spasm system